MIEQSYDTVYLAPAGKEDNPIVFLSTEQGRKDLWKYLMKTPGNLTVWKGVPMTYPEWQAIPAHSGR